jgi:hopene-associated glycosyltransferase HpnB
LIAFLAFCSLAVWVLIWLLPWKAWSTRQQIEPASGETEREPDVTALVPARNEADQIAHILSAVAPQVDRVVLIDDNSVDGTQSIAQALQLPNLTIVAGAPLPGGWIGKVWALEQGLREVQTAWTLLLDADIEIQPGAVAMLFRQQTTDDFDLVSVMAALRMATFWEKLLAPAFIYFFKLIYPFALANRAGNRVAAAAGGCVLVRTEALRRIGGFVPIQSAIIDDCALAKQIKTLGGKNWIGLSRAVISKRAYPRLADFWEMVARSAFTQLRYSTLQLLLTTGLMLLVFWVPVVAVFSGDPTSFGAGLLAFALLASLYCPILRFYGLSRAWSVAMPVIAFLFLLMTWSSAFRYWLGRRSSWKGRTYNTSENVP